MYNLHRNIFELLTGGLTVLGETVFYGLYAAMNNFWKRFQQSRIRSNKS